MNTPEPYERRLDRTLPEPAPTPEAEKAVDALAVHRDPSVQTAEVKQETERSQPSVAWVRPSEMPTPARLQVRTSWHRPPSRAHPPRTSYPWRCRLEGVAPNHPHLDRST